MKRSFIFTVLIVLVMGATIIAMGALAYNAGLTLGIAQSAELQGSGFATPLGPAGSHTGTLSSVSVASSC